MNEQLLRAMMMGMGGAGGAGGMSTPTGVGSNPFGEGGVSPQLLQFASGALTGGLPGGVGKLLGGLLAQRMRQRAQQQNNNPLDQRPSGNLGVGVQPLS